MASGRSVTPRWVEEVGRWDAEADVVVVGYGCAGSSAALAAAIAGADVLVLDRAGGWGGASAMAGGLIYLGGGTSVQKACGFEDSAEEMFKFLMAATGPDADEAKVSLYSEGSVDHFNWLVECGVPFKHTFYSLPCWEPPTDDGLMFSGGENAYPWNEIAAPAPRAHVPQMDAKLPGERSGGSMLMQHLTASAERAGVKVQYDTMVDCLVVTRDGAVAGVIAHRFGEEVAVRARKGVVLSAGGFIANQEMLAQHTPRLIGGNMIGTDGDDGRGIRMAQAVGAAVKHMDAGEAAIGIDPGLLVRGLIVNTQGQRFINEDTYPGRVGQQALFRYDGRTFLVIDERSFEETPASSMSHFQPAWVCETVAELESEMGVPTGALQATVEIFNRHAEGGEDPLFHKASKWVRPLQAPFGAIDMRYGSAGYGVFTLGGLQTTVDGAVLDQDGGAIPGLYAAGRTSSGIPAWGYCSGTSLGDGTFFGRRTGKAVAARTDP